MCLEVARMVRASRDVNRMLSRMVYIKHTMKEFKFRQSFLENVGRLAMDGHFSKGSFLTP